MAWTTNEEGHDHHLLLLVVVAVAVVAVVVMYWAVLYFMCPCALTDSTAEGVKHGVG